MKKIIFTCFVLIHFTAIAQIKTTKLVSADGYGWMYDYQFESGPQTLNGFTFSARQLDICHSLVRWMKASYVPQKFLGDVRRFTNVGLKKMDGKLLPLINYGATAYTWSVEMKGGKLAPIQETEMPWGITVNERFGGGLGKISVGDDYYFILPDNNYFDKGTPQEVLNKYDIKRLPQFKNYYPAYNTVNRYLREPGILSTLLLCKDNHLPIVKITNEELLQKAKQMIDREHQKKLSEILEKNKGNQKNIDYFNGYEETNYQKALATFSKHMGNYKDRMNETAQVPDGFDYIDFVNGYDIFTRIQINEGTPHLKTYTVYKFEPGVLEQTKQGIPLWIRVSWAWSLNDEKTKPMHESIINNFDFQYLYDYVFNPDKVKGRSYKPLRSPDFKEAIVVTEKSTATKEAEKNNNIYFFEDFSSNATGQKPKAWNSALNSKGSYTRIAEMEEEKWMEIAGNDNITPTHLKKPLPQNFELSFDVAVPKDFTWGAKRLDMILAKENSSASSFRFSIKPGSGGQNGETQVENNFVNGYANGTKWYSAPGFSNDKKINKAKVVIRKNGEVLQVFVNNEKIADYPKAMPATTVFNTLKFSHGRSDGETEKYFISNIKITKL